MNFHTTFEFTTKFVKSFLVTTFLRSNFSNREPNRLLEFTLKISFLLWSWSLLCIYLYTKMTLALISVENEVNCSSTPKEVLTELRNSRPEVFLGKSVLKICSKFTGEHPCWSAISIKLQSNFIEFTFS